MYGPGTKLFEARSPARQYQGGKMGVRTALTVLRHSSTAEGYKCYILRTNFLRGSPRLSWEFIGVSLPRATVEGARRPYTH
jgi:hypothetical protein